MSDAPLQQTPAEAASRQMREMAANVERNAEAGFAGAFVIVGPDGLTKKMLLVNDAPEPAMFWSNVEMMCKLAQAELEQGTPMNPRQRTWG